MSPCNSARCHLMHRNRNNQAMSEPMTIQPKSYVEIAWNAIKVFSNDGTVDEGELNFLLGLALRDQVVDADEKRVLASIFDRAEASSRLSATVRERIQEARRRHQIGQ